MFYGEFQHTVDPKGRVIVPSAFREELGEKFIVTKGLDECLFVYSKTEWSNLEAKLKTLPFSNKDARAFVRFFFSGATECEVDKQGRILIPQNLRAMPDWTRKYISLGFQPELKYGTGASGKTIVVMKILILTVLQKK